MTPEQIAGKTEGSQQTALFAWAALTDIRQRHPELQWLYHVPNGDSRGDDPRSAMITGARLKAQGVKSGVPDVALDVPRRGYHGARIEMKIGKNKPSDNQKKWIEWLASNGYAIVVCYSWIEARDFLIWYLEK